MYDLIYEEGVKTPLGKDEISSYLNALLSYLEEEGDFSLSFVSAKRIKQLNASYRNKDEETDILTFALNDGEAFPSVEEGKELGDIFICVEKMEENAKEYNVSAEEELKRLILHGILHLEGDEHETNNFLSEPMLKKQEQILKKFI